MSTSAVGLFTQSDDDLLDTLKAEAARLRGTRESRHTENQLPLSRLAQLTEQAFRALIKRRVIPTPAPATLTTYIRQLRASATDEVAAFRALEQTTEALEASITRLEQYLAGSLADDEDEEDEEDEEFAEDDELAEDAPESDDCAPEDEEATDAVGWIDDSEQTLLALKAEIDRRRLDPTYSRVSALEDRFAQLYGHATTTLRDIIVSAIMTAHERWTVPALDGIVLDDDEIVTAAATTFIGDGAPLFLHTIAEARENDGLPAPITLDVVDRTIEDPPRLNDGAARRYFLCPCCRERFTPDHVCESWNCQAQRFSYLAGTAVGTRCAFSAEVVGTGIHRRLRSIPFGRSLMTRRNARTYCLLPTLAYGKLRREVRKRYSAGTITAITMLEDGMEITEQIPALPQPGTPVSTLLEVYSATRTPRPTKVPYEHWWYIADSRSKHHAEGITIVEYATAYDVIEYRGRERSTPTVIDRSWREHAIQSAIVGDRLYSQFGPRVERIEELPRRPKERRRRAGEQGDPLIKTVKNGNCWKRIYLTVDPIDSHDNAELTAAIATSILRTHDNENLTGLRLLRELGAHSVARLIDEADRVEDCDNMPRSWRRERFDEGCTDAAEYLADRLAYLIHCAGCGVYETCHEQTPFPCSTSRIKSAEPAQVQFTLLAA